jgi:hypothetical protein
MDIAEANGCTGYEAKVNRGNRRKSLAQKPQAYIDHREIKYHLQIM